MKRVIFAVVVVLIALAYLAGYWPERTKLREAQSKLDQVSSQLTSAQQTVRLYRLQDQILTLVHETASQNYGNAMTLSTKFFDGVREEISQVQQPALKASLQSILAQRDAVTTALAKGDPAVHDMLQQAASNLHQIVEQPEGSGGGAEPAKPAKPAKPSKSSSPPATTSPND